MCAIAGGPVAGMLIYGPLLNAVVGITSGGVWPRP
jgi:hypothetical protein